MHDLVGATLQARLGDEGQRLDILRGDGRLLLTHRAMTDRRPSIHPIVAPDGQGILTEDAPAHHPWQHGLYTGLNVVNDVGFWKETAQDGTFHSRPIAPPTVQGGTVCWTLETAWRAPDGTVFITERQDWALTDHVTTFELELDWRLHAEVDLTIGQYMAGGLFLRMPYVDECGGTAVNSERQINDAAEAQRARWVAVSMPISGRDGCAGMAIMDHPSNPDYPVTWRVDHQLGISPSRCIAGGWHVAKGDVDRYTYLITVFCGEPDLVALETRWQTFAADTAL